MTTRAPAMSSIDFGALCRQVDKDFDKERSQPVAYEFSQGRKFKDTLPPGSAKSHLFWEELTNIRWEQMTALWQNS